MDEKKLPVILVPGFASSQLECKALNTSSEDNLLTSSWRVLWLRFEMMLSFTKIGKLFRLKVNPFTCLCNNHRMDIAIRPYNFGSVDGVKYLEKFTQHMTFIFCYFIRALKSSFGYIKNHDIYGAPYDFRSITSQQEMDEYFKKFDNLVLESYKVHKKPCIIVCHSLGCLLMAHYFSTKTNLWKKKYIDSWISISGPFGGSGKALQALLIGNIFEFPIFDEHNELFLKTIRSFPSIYYMLPNKNSFPPQTVLVKTENREFRLAEMDEMFRHFDIDHYDTIKKINVNNKYNLKTGITSLFIYSHGFDTVESIYSENSEYQEKTGDGDGSVNLSSLQFCHHFLKENPDITKVKVFKGVDHHKILKHEHVLAEIMSFISQRLGVPDPADTIRRTGFLFW